MHDKKHCRITGLYINEVRLTACGTNITTLEMHSPISLMSHLSSSPMDVFSRDYGKMNYIDNKLESMKFVASVVEYPVVTVFLPDIPEL